jgi:hypothetical protein
MILRKVTKNVTLFLNKTPSDLLGSKEFPKYFLLVSYNIYIQTTSLSANKILNFFFNYSYTQTTF